MKDFNPLAFISAVFEEFRKPFMGIRQPKERTRCAWCSGRLLHIDFASDCPEVLRWNAMVFCSKKCELAAEGERQPSPTDLTRQRNRHLARVRAKNEIAESMGAGPAAMNPRRNRRKAILGLARKMYRERG